MARTGTAFSHSRRYPAAIFPKKSLEGGGRVNIRDAIKEGQEITIQIEKRAGKQGLHFHHLRFACGPLPGTDAEQPRAGGYPDVLKARTGVIFVKQ